MKFRKSLVIAACAATIGVSFPLASSAAVDIYFNVAPPAPRYEVTPAPRAGYVWVPGYWDARGNRHTWVRGHWERERHGYRYVEPRWTERDGRWYLERPRWARDRDRDGIPNRYDRDRDNDGIPNQYDRDRDNDGTPNRYDSRPDNQNRS